MSERLGAHDLGEWSQDQTPEVSHDNEQPQYLGDRHTLDFYEAWRCDSWKFLDGLQEAVREHIRTRITVNAEDEYFCPNLRYQGLVIKFDFTEFSTSVVFFPQSIYATAKADRIKKAIVDSVLEVMQEFE